MRYAGLLLIALVCVATSLVSVPAFGDEAFLAVSVNQSVDQADPTGSSPIKFTVVFSEPVTDFEAQDIALSGTSGATVAEIVISTGDLTTYVIEVSGMTQSGTVISGIAAGAVHNASGNANAESTSTDNEVTYDITAPTVTMDQSGDQADPTNLTSIKFTAVFSEPVLGFDTGDVSLTGTAGATIAEVTNPSGDSMTFEVSVSGMTRSGTVIAAIAAGAAYDALGNANAESTSTDNEVTYDITVPTVTIDQSVDQTDPTGLTPIKFTAVFSEPVTGFDTGDVSLTGTAGATIAEVTNPSSDLITFEVAVSGMTQSGTVIAGIAAGVAQDALGNANAESTSTDNKVTYDSLAPTVRIDQSIAQADPTSSSPIKFTAVFSEPVTDFDARDITLSGTAAATVAEIVIATGDLTTYVIEVSGMRGPGTVIATIPAGVAHDVAGNPNTESTSTDNEVTYDVPVDPVNVSLAPAGGPLPVDSTTTVTSVYRDLNGFGDLRKCYLLINYSLLQTNAVLVFYDAGSNRVYLKNDANTSWGTGYFPGTDIVLSNSQCEVFLKDVTASKAGTDITVAWSMKLKTTMVGGKLCGYMYASDAAGHSTGWKKLAGFYTPSAPVCVSVDPSTGNVLTGGSHVFTTQYSDENGYSDVYRAYLQISATSSQANAVLLMYDSKLNKVYLKNDANTVWSTGAVPGADTVLENSQGILHLSGTSVTHVGGQVMSIGWSISLKASQSGLKLSERMLAVDMDGLSSEWSVKGYLRALLEPPKSVCVDPGVNTISDAISIANDGDTLVLAAGAYAQTVQMLVADKSLIFAPAGIVTVDCTGLALPSLEFRNSASVVQGSPEAYFQIGTEVAGSGGAGSGVLVSGGVSATSCVTLNFLRVTNTSNTAAAAIRAVSTSLYTSTSLSCYDCRVSDVAQDGFSCSAQSAVSTTMICERCVAENVGEDGFTAHQNARMLTTDCEASGGQTGFAPSFGCSWTSERDYLHDNNKGPRRCNVYLAGSPNFSSTGLRLGGATTYHIRLVDSSALPSICSMDGLEITGSATNWVYVGSGTGAAVQTLNFTNSVFGGSVLNHGMDDAGASLGTLLNVSLDACDLDMSVSGKYVIASRAGRGTSWSVTNSKVRNADPSGGGLICLGNVSVNGCTVEAGVVGGIGIYGAGYNVTSNNNTITAMRPYAGGAIQQAGDILNP